MKQSFIALTIVFLLAAALWYGYRGTRTPLLPTSSSTASVSAQATPREDRAAVAALGRIEPASGIVELSGLAGDRLESLTVQAADSVEAGQVLGYLASYEPRKLEFEAAAALWTEADDRYAAEQALADSRVLVAQLAVQEAETAELDIAAQRTRVELAERNHALALKDWERLQSVREQRGYLVTDQESERQRMLVDQAAAAPAAEQSTLQKLTQTRELRLQAAQADVRAAEASSRQMLSAIPRASLAKQRELARVRMEQSVIRAPNAGTVLSVLVQQGETLSGPILRLADLSRMVVVAEVYETASKRVRAGQTAQIFSPAFAAPFDEQGLSGVVRSVAPMIMMPALKSLDPLAMADRRVVEVVIDLDPESVAPASRLCNLQVDVTIWENATHATLPDVP